MHVFTGVDWAGTVLPRRSTTGYIVFAAGLGQAKDNSVNVIHTK